MGNRGKSRQDHIVPGSLLEHIIGIEGDWALGKALLSSDSL